MTESENYCYFYELLEMKMVKRNTCWLLCVIVSAVLSDIYSQNSSIVEQRKILDQQAEELISLSDYVFGKDIRLVSGKIYSQPKLKAAGHPFMQSRDWKTGSVDINGKNFTGLSLNYDIFEDKLIFLDETPDGNKKVLLLNKNQVRGFTIANHSFVTLSPSEILNITENQYFEVIYSGSVSFYNRWTKDFETVATQEFPSGLFLEAKITRFFRKGNELHKINSRFDLLKLCEDHSEEVRKYLRKHRINVRKALDEELFGVAEFYDSLKND